MTEPVIPNRVPWSPDFEVGHPVLDAQHQALLHACELLAEHCDGPDAAAFAAAFERIQAMAREHFETEALLLAGGDSAEDHRLECEEFGYLAGEIATTTNFDRLEIQRFFSLWWVGHITGWAQELRACLRRGSAPA